MTVMSPELPPSRAGSLPLIADDLALDFANTESGRGFPSHENHLREAANMSRDWLKHAKALPAEDADWLQARGFKARRSRRGPPRRRRSPCVRRFTTSARRSGVARSRPRLRSPVFPPFMRDLSLEAALAPGVLSCRWRWSVRASPVEAALGPIALAAVRLFTEGDFHRIRECGGHACGWLFYDRSKNNRRRWCEMEVCGNRAKQRRLAARRRGA